MAAVGVLLASRGTAMAGDLDGGDYVVLRLAALHPRDQLDAAAGLLHRLWETA